MAGSAGILVYMLGGFEMYYEGALVQIKKKLTAKPMLLLQLLLYAGENGIARSALIEALYGQDHEIDAANNLNVAVTQLRKLLKETHLPKENFIRVNGDRYTFESEAPIFVDIHEVRALWETAEKEKGNARLGTLYTLVELFRGRFLPNLDGEMWVEIARSDYHRIYTESLVEVCRELKKAEKYDEIMRLTTLAAKLFPFEEWQAWQQECLLAKGKISEAYELYRKTEKMYLAEMNTPPEHMRAGFREAGNDAAGRTGGAETLYRWLKQADQDGPYSIPFPSFLYVYNLINRMNSTVDRPTPFCMLTCTLANVNGDPEISAEDVREEIEQLERALTRTLRWEDVFTHYSRNQYLVILFGARLENHSVVSERIIKRFADFRSSARYTLNCSLLPAEEMPTSAKGI